MNRRISDWYYHNFYEGWQDRLDEMNVSWSFPEVFGNKSEHRILNPIEIEISTGVTTWLHPGMYLVKFEDGTFDVQFDKPEESWKNEKNSLFDSEENWFEEEEEEDNWLTNL